MNAPHSVNAPHFGRTVNAPHFGRKLNENVKWNQCLAPCDCHYYAIQKFIAFRDFTWGSANCPDSEKGSAICPILGAAGDYDPWMLPGPKRDFVISIIGFALQRANARMVRDAHFRQRKNRAGGRYASGVEVESDIPSSTIDCVIVI
jgi:hypothetical protein